MSLPFNRALPRPDAVADARDAVAWDAALLEREPAIFRRERERIPPKQRPHYTLTRHAALLEWELTVFRQERKRIPPKERPHYTSTHRLEILQIMGFG